jgi:purine-binding chemotaxis protein CheW
MTPDASEILRARARVLARETGPESAAQNGIEVVEFHLAHEAYAVEMRWVEEVYPFRELTPLPHAPAFIRGVVNVRGRILPVFDLKRFFDLPEKGLTDLHRIIVARSQDLHLGLLADVVIGIRSVTPGSLQPSLPTLTGIRADYLKGVDGGRLIVLNLERIFSDPRIIVHQEVET